MCLSRLKAIQPSLRSASGPHSFYSRVQASSARLVEPMAGSHPSHTPPIKKPPHGWLFNWGGVSRIDQINPYKHITNFTDKF